MIINLDRLQTWQRQRTFCQVYSFFKFITDTWCNWTFEKSLLVYERMRQHQIHQPGCPLDATALLSDCDTAYVMLQSPCPLEVNVCNVVLNYFSVLQGYTRIVNLDMLTEFLKLYNFMLSCISVPCILAAVKLSSSLCPSLSFGFLFLSLSLLAYKQEKTSTTPTVEIVLSLAAVTNTTPWHPLRVRIGCPTATFNFTNSYIY